MVAILTNRYHKKWKELCVKNTSNKYSHNKKKPTQFLIGMSFSIQLSTLILYSKFLLVLILQFFKLSLCEIVTSDRLPATSEFCVFLVIR